MGRGTFSPGAREPRSDNPERRHRGTTRSEKVEHRAHWIMQTWAHSFSLGPQEIKARVRQEFGCGSTAAEQALSRAYELYKERATAPELIHQLAAQYLELAEQAKRAGKEAEARKCLDSLRAHLGLGAPERVEHSGTIGVSRDAALEPLTDEELALMARLDKIESGLGGGQAH